MRVGGNESAADRGQIREGKGTHLEVEVGGQHERGEPLVAREKVPVERLRRDDGSRLLVPAVRYHRPGENNARIELRDGDSGERGAR